MGVSDLQSAFNDAAASAFTCTRAFLGYTQAHDTEWQILEFRGTDSNGAEFIAKSDPVRPNGDIIAAAVATAKRLIDQRKPAT